MTSPTYDETGFGRASAPNAATVPAETRRVCMGHTPSRAARRVLSFVSGWAVTLLGLFALMLCAWFPGLSERWGDEDE